MSLLMTVYYQLKYHLTKMSTWKTRLVDFNKEPPKVKFWFLKQFKFKFV